jgi:predicted dehydrogenase
MIRLAVSGAEEATWREVVRRLRGAAIEAFLAEARGREPPGAWHAVVFVGRRRLEKATIERFLGAGKHVLLAAEPCLSRDDLETLWGNARQSGVQLAVVNPDRYLPSRQLIRQQLAGNLGAAGLVRLHRWEPVAEERVLDPLGLPGPLVRDLELTLGLLGKPPNLVYALEQRGDEHDVSAGWFLQVHLGFAGGGMALIDYDNRLPPGDGYQALSVIGSSGAAYADDQQNVQLLYRGGRPQAVLAGEAAGQHAALVQDFVDALQAGHDLSANRTAWQDVFAVAEAVRQALASRRAVPLEGR